jgi:hypothetical protein
LHALRAAHAAARAAAHAAARHTRSPSFASSASWCALRRSCRRSSLNVAPGSLISSLAFTSSSTKRVAWEREAEQGSVGASATRWHAARRVRRAIAATHGGRKSEENPRPSVGCGTVRAGGGTRRRVAARAARAVHATHLRLR